MSLCIRTIPNKFTPFVGTRKRIIRVDRQLPKHIIGDSSAFLQEFFRSEATPDVQARRRTNSFRLMSNGLKKSENTVAWKCEWKEEQNSVESGEKTDRAVVVAFSYPVSTQSILGRVQRSEKSESVARVEKGQSEQSRDTPDDATAKPSQEQLNRVYGVLCVDLPAFFTKPLDYKIYHPRIVFENNIKGTVTRGLHDYVRQAAVLKIIGHVRFAYVKFEVLKMTIHPEDSSIKVRWRIRGLAGYKVFLVFWKFKLWRLQPTLDQLESWHDGFSTFYVDGSGKVVKHVADKMMPDQDNDIATKDKTSIAAKLSLFLGLLIPRDLASSDLSPLDPRSTRFKGDADC